MAQVICASSSTQSFISLSAKAIRSELSPSPSTMCLSSHTAFPSLHTKCHPHEGSKRIVKRRGVGSNPGMVFMTADYYTTLGVSRNASNQDIKSAYRRLARQNLRDDDASPIYDGFGEAGVKEDATGRAGGPGGGADMEDIKYFVSVLVGCIGAAALIKYGSLLFPTFLAPDFTKALVIITLPVVASIVLLLYASTNRR